MSNMERVNELVQELHTIMESTRDDLQSTWTKSKWLFDGCMGVLVVLVPWENGALVVQFDKSVLPWPVGEASPEFTYKMDGQEVRKHTAYVEIEEFDEYDVAAEYFERICL